jgi:hypothetical protein
MPGAWFPPPLVLIGLVVVRLGQQIGVRVLPCLAPWAGPLQAGSLVYGLGRNTSPPTKDTGAFFCVHQTSL